MLLNSALRAEIPTLKPLEAAPRWRISLTEPPRARWIGAGRHGILAREDYRLPDLWCIHLYQWTGALQVDGVALPVRPGYASIAPPDRPLSHFFGRPDRMPRLHLSAGFSFPPIEEEQGDDATLLLPMMQDLGDDFGNVYRVMEEAIRKFATHPRRAEAHLWEVLWQLAERTQNSSETVTGSHPAVQKARERIELRLSDPQLRVKELAEAIDLSQSQLTRLFHAQLGTTIQNYIRDRRIARARHLLLYSTTPIKSIAAQVGLPDLHQFNKTVRAATGQSPRALRLAQESSKPIS